ncbi:MAG: YlxR family protein [Cyanobacteria bacterium NC_groundwater_1444_Ag_S-0.65um_54_12]|nr:YlxR family protein [Cyanobacteria bacterium NC_groundwater_1444_Ag_S-0.65um_54_12]
MSTRRQIILLRQCITCRSAGSKLQLIRVVRVSTGEVRLDLESKSPGRGAYMHRSVQCIQEALRRRYLERVLQCPIPPEVQRALAKIADVVSAEHKGDHG